MVDRTPFTFTWSGGNVLGHVLIGGRTHASDEDTAFVCIDIITCLYVYAAQRAEAQTMNQKIDVGIEVSAVPSNRRPSTTAF